MWRIRYFFFRVRNLMRWFKTIWGDRDWDYLYLTEIVVTKLKHMISAWEDESMPGSYERMDEDLRWMRIAHVIGKRIIDSYYWNQDSVVVNHRNAGRFDKSFILLQESGHFKDQKYLRIHELDLAEHKATYLFWTIIREKSQRWWS